MTHNTYTPSVENEAIIGLIIAIFVGIPVTCIILTLCTIAFTRHIRAAAKKSKITPDDKALPDTPRITKHNKSTKYIATPDDKELPDTELQNRIAPRNSTLDIVCQILPHTHPVRLSISNCSNKSIETHTVTSGPRFSGSHDSIDSFLWTGPESSYDSVPCTDDIVTIRGWEYRRKYSPPSSVNIEQA